MSANSDLINLYSGRILELAADIPHHERLTHPDATIKRRSPLCGSTVTVDLCLRDGQVSAFGQDVKACALGQAAASITGANVIGTTPAQIRHARDQLNAMLRDNGAPPTPPFEGFRVLEPARDFKNRHASIMLTLDALVEALDMLENQSASV